MHNVFGRPRLQNHRPMHKFASISNLDTELIPPLSIGERRITGLSIASERASVFAMVETVGESILVIILKIYNRFNLFTIVALYKNTSVTTSINLIQ